MFEPNFDISFNNLNQTSNNTSLYSRSILNTNQTNNDIKVAENRNLFM